MDLARACLWPHVKELFDVDFFPHRLAAATDLLRAVDFGENADEKVVALAAELTSALDISEQVASGNMKETYYKSAEESDHE